MREIGRLLRTIGLLSAVVLGAVTGRADELDDSLRAKLQRNGITALEPLPTASPAKYELGRALFFDKHLSGNNNISCASCHHPSLASGDARSLPSGTGGEGLGPDRTPAAGHNPVPRNSPEIFDRGQSTWTTMFWDSRVESVGGKLVTPAGPDLPSDIDRVLAAQALFPVTSRDEMRGLVGDTDSTGNHNELADFDDDDLPGIWQALMNRLLAIPDYNRLFSAAFPEVSNEQLGFEHAADAIATFEEQAFSTRDTAWDRYVDGDNQALTTSAKRGAHLFYGSANCAACHSGNLLTDQEHHNIGAPQLGPGKDSETGLDPGRSLVTDSEADQFAFRTPPLRNVAATGPWMHNGSYTNLEDTVRLYTDPESALRNYDVQQLDADLQDTVRMDAETLDAVTETIDPLVSGGVDLSDQDVDDLAAFLFSLTSPSLDLLASTVPDSVPSGLSVDAMPLGYVSILYDKETGELSVDGPADTELSAVMLRIADTPDDPLAELSFLPHSATWSDDVDIVLSDDDRAQSFLEYRDDMPFTLQVGDSLGPLLPVGLTEDAIDGRLTAMYRLLGSPTLWTADVTVVPEPSSLLIWLFPLTAALGRRASDRRRKPRSSRARGNSAQ